jgi:hypothetical protein
MGPRTASVIAITTALLLAGGAAWAQSQAPRPGQLPPSGGTPRAQPAPPAQRSQPAPPAQRAQPAPPPPPQQQQITPKPYQPVAIGTPEPVKDPSFETFRKQIGAVAEKKDRRALAAMIAPNFFWMGEKGDKADKRRSGIDNLAKAMGLDAKDGPGWDMLVAAANDPTGTPFPDRKDTICAPADPVFKPEELEALAKATGTNEGDWGFPTQSGIEVHAAPQPNSPVVEKLGMHFVLVMPEDAPDNQPSPMLRVVTPSGKTGFVPIEAINPLGSDQICYSKEGAGWKISGFIGGEQ